VGGVVRQEAQIIPLVLDGLMDSTWRDRVPCECRRWHFGLATKEKQASNM
jgi:hypothetical protein